MAGTDRSALSGLGYAKPSVRLPLTRLSDAASTADSAEVAEEIPVALVYNARPHVVVMATPADFEDLAVGFTRTEGIVDAAGEIERIDVVRASHGVELQIQIPAHAAARIEERSRAIASRTGCGLCGVQSIEEALRVPSRRIAAGASFAASALWRAAAQLRDKQTLNNATNAVHAAAWSTPGGDLEVVREDVGRHNALDKVLGALARAGRDPASGFIVVTSRASYELVQKVAICGVPLLAAISRPTNLAIKFADASGVTLVGLLRGTSANVYTPQSTLRAGPP